MTTSTLRAANSAGGVAKTDREMRDGMDCNYPDCGCCHDSKCSDAPAVEAEPVAWLVRRYGNDGWLIGDEVYLKKPDIRSASRTDFIPLYTHPSSPVSAEKRIKELSDLLIRAQYNVSEVYQNWHSDARAALAALKGTG